MQQKGQEAAGDAPLRLDDLRGRDLTGRDLTTDEFKGLLPEHLAGTILTGAILPPDIARFPALEQVKAISGEARKVFIGLLAACVYCWLVIGTTTDVALILNTATSPLPIINTPVPIANFYVVGAAVLAAVYCYLHFYLLRLWRTLATLPAVFPDGTPLDDRTDPWLLTNLVRSEFPHLRATAPPLARVENLLTIALAWWLVPLTLIALWARYLPAHDIGGLAWLSLLIAITIFFGRQSFHLARATLNREGPSRRLDGSRSGRLFLSILGDVRYLRPDQVIVWLFLPFFIFINLSGSARVQSPRDSSGNIVVFSLTSPWESIQKVDKSLAKYLNFVGIRTYADLREVDVAERPPGWDGENWSQVRRIDLRNRDLAFADAKRAFLANADLRGANLTGARFEHADLRGADFYDEDRLDSRPARLQNVNLVSAQLQHADLRSAELRGADLQAAQLQHADLQAAQLQHADLQSAHLQGADLREARLQGANLGDAQLQGADLRKARLQGANLWSAQLQGTDLRFTQLQGADLFTAQLQGADLQSAQLQGANLWSAQLQGAFLWSAQLQGTDLLTARLQGADLRLAGLQGANLRSTQLQGVNLSGAQLHGATLAGAQLQGADLRAMGLWRAVVEGEPTDWELADLRGVELVPMADSKIDTVIANATRGIPNDERRKAVTELLTIALRTGERPARPEFLRWIRWGEWGARADYDEDLAKFLGDLACGRYVPEAQTSGLARRALVGMSEERQRVWPALFAARVTGPDCPPAEGLPEEMRRELEELAGRSEAAAAAAEASPPDPVE